MTTWNEPPAWGRFEWRRQQLLTAIREQGGEWTTGRVKQLYRRHLAGHIYRHNIRGDGTPRRYYTLRTEGVTT
jgi:hypothetical protein